MATSREPARTVPATVMRFGGFQLDLQTGELSRNGTKKRLQGQQLQLLELLLQKPGELFTREQIQQHLWPDGTVVEFEHSVNAAVKRVREALGDNAERPTFIETIPRRGYRFIAHVENCDEAASAAIEESRARVLLSGPLGELWNKRTFLVTGCVAASLIVASLATWRVFSARSGLTESYRTRPKINSLAVLPLKNLSGDPSQEYLADGMTEALIGRLSRIHDLRVISRTSVMRFKDTKLSVPEIARTLDDHFWSEAYDQELQDTLQLESDVAQSIARRVEVSVSAEERSRVAAARRVSPEVYESYLRGEEEFLKSHNGAAGFEKSIEYFEEAINRDPTFAPAYVGMAAAYDRLLTNFVGATPDEERPKVMSAAQKALELDPELAEPHDLLADVYVRQWQWAAAEAELKRALELDPNDVGAHLGFARWLLCQGRTDEALAWSQRAGKLDPFGLPSVMHAWILFNARRYDEAIRELRSVSSADPDLAVAHWYLGFALTANGQPEEAIRSLEKAAALTHGSAAVMGDLVRAYAHAGRRADALGVLDELKRRQQTAYVPSAAFVNAYLGLGDDEQALVWLEKGYQEQSGILGLAKVYPYFDPLRGDPRFKELAHRVGLD